MSRVLDLTHPAAADPALVGGKVSGLTQLVRADVPVPPAFVVTRAGFDEWLRGAGTADLVGEILDQVRRTSEAVTEAERRIDALLADLPVPPAVADAVRAAYAELGAGVGEPTPAVAVRSSATTEDTSGNSFAGEYVTVLDVTGADAVVDAVRQCWRSAFRREALAYAATRRVDLASAGMAVAVQAMVRARAAGVMFTLNPVTGDRSRVVIEATRGLGTGVVGGEVTPERYVVDKVTLEVTTERGPADPGAEPCLTPAEAADLAATGKRLERVLGYPLDLEWAIDERWPYPESIRFVQCRPETVWSKKTRSTPFDPNASTLGWITANLVGRRASS